MLKRQRTRLILYYVYPSLRLERDRFQCQRSTMGTKYAPNFGLFFESHMIAQKRATMRKRRKFRETDSFRKIFFDIPNFWGSDQAITSSFSSQTEVPKVHFELEHGLILSLNIA